MNLVSTFTTSPHSDTSDAEVLAKARATPDMFDRIVDRHHARVFRYVASRIGADAAEDVVSDTFLTAFATRHRFDADRADTALPWLLGIATRLIARQRHVQARWLAKCAAAAAQSGVPIDGADRAIERIDAAQLAGPLAHALKSLSERERAPLLLHVLGGLSYDEVAAALDVASGTVRSRISRARARLAGMMDGAPR